MKRTAVVFLLLGALFLFAGLLTPPEAHAGIVVCWVERGSCTTTYTGPLGVECCCAYHCPSGVTWVCREGEYCPG